jgi:hypothetical protein
LTEKLPPSGLVTEIKKKQKKFPYFSGVSKEPTTHKKYQSCILPDMFPKKQRSKDLLRCPPRKHDGYSQDRIFPPHSCFTFPFKKIAFVKFSPLERNVLTQQKLCEKGDIPLENRTTKSQRARINTPYQERIQSVKQHPP